MKSILIFAGIILAPAVAAGDPLTNGLSVSEPYDGDLSPVVFDQDPAQMTDEQFRVYCGQFNARQIADAKVRHQQYLTERGPLPVTKTTISTGSSNSRRGGGYGLGGFGGAGGYLGYGDGTGYSGGGGFGLGGLGLGGLGLGGLGFGGGAGGFGLGRGIGNNISNNYTNTTTTTESTLPDLNDIGGGPVTIVNPYCHDYWKSHFHLVSQAPSPGPEKPRPSE